MRALDLALDNRIRATVPPRIAVAEEFRGPSPFYDPQVGFSLLRYAQENVYSLSCRTEVLLPLPGSDSKPIVINDLRVCEIALGLIQAALQDSEESQGDLVYLAISRLALEQSYRYAAPLFKAGLLAHHLRMEAYDEVMRRRHKISVVGMTPDEDRYHLEQVTQFVLTHEVTHYFIYTDEHFRQGWRDFMGKLLQWLQSVWGETETPTKFLKQAVDARVADLAAWRVGAPPTEVLEETICDVSALLSLVNALKRRNRLRENLKGLMLSSWATIAATWVISMVRSTVEGLLIRGEANMANALVLLQERSGVALLVLTQLAGEALLDDSKSVQGALIEAWRVQPDFEELILRNFNSLFASDSLEQMLIVGDAIMQNSFSTPTATDAAILRHFNWRLDGAAPKHG